jgi:hypothetical protein
MILCKKNSYVLLANLILTSLEHLCAPGYYTTAANERLQLVFETKHQTFPIESAGHVGLTPLRKPLLECLFKHSNPVGDP